MNLNGEDIAVSLQSAIDYTAEFHFCNCVTDPQHQLFGDHHIPFGSPGVLDVPQIVDIMTMAIRIGFFVPDIRPGIFCEVLNQQPDNFDAGVALMRKCRNILENAWELAGEKSAKES